MCPAGSPAARSVPASSTGWPPQTSRSMKCRASAGATGPRRRRSTACRWRPEMSSRSNSGWPSRRRSLTRDRTHRAGGRATRIRDLPNLVIEGMALAGRGVGANRGILYLRHEYAPEQARFEAELKRAYELGVLGMPDDSGWQFDIEVFVSPGGYILGEETALLEALEDKRGEARNKPPFPGERGLWGKHTLINNCENLGMCGGIARGGGAWWDGAGQPDCDQLMC